MNKIPNEVYDEVKQLYLEQIEKPKRVELPQFLLCPIGLIGAGKTTVVKPLAKKLKLVRVSGDEIRKIFKEKGFGYEKVKEVAFEIINELLASGFSIAIDSDCISKESQEKIEEWRKKFNLKIVWIHINPPEAFILKKLGGLAPNWLGSAEDMIKNYYQRKPLHKTLDFTFAYTFDTSLGNIDTQIKEAIDIIHGILSADL